MRKIIRKLELNVWKKKFFNILRANFCGIIDISNFKGYRESLLIYDDLTSFFKIGVLGIIKPKDRA